MKHQLEREEAIWAWLGVPIGRIKQPKSVGIHRKQLDKEARKLNERLKLPRI